MPETPEFHRTFRLYDSGVTPAMKKVLGQLPRGMRNTVGVIVEVDREKRSRPGFMLTDLGILPIDIVKQKGQDFSRFATAFERSYSALCSGWLAPVLDVHLVVIGHRGFVSPRRIFFQQESGREQHNTPLNTLIAQGRTVQIAAIRTLPNNSFTIVEPDAAGSVCYSTITQAGDDILYDVLADSNGKVLFELGRKTRDGLSAPAVDPFLVLFAGQLTVAIGKGLGRMLVRKIAARLEKKVIEKGEEEAGKTLIGMGAAGPSGYGVPPRVVAPGAGAPGRAAASSGSAGAAASRGSASAASHLPRPRIGEGGRLELTMDEMGNYLASLFKSHPELTALMRIRALKGDALKAEIKKVLESWSRRTGKQVESVPTGYVQRLTGTRGNFASMQGNKLLIEEQIFADPTHFHHEIVHELASAALGGGGVPHIWVVRNELWNAQKILEHWVEYSGSFDFFRNLLGGSGI